MLPESVRETLLGWHGPFEDKKRRKVWKAEPLCLFWVVWNARNRIAFEGEELFIQRLKSLFVSYLWSEAKGHLDDVPLNSFLLSRLVGSLVRVGWLYFFFCILVFLWWRLVVAVYFLYTLGCFFGSPF